MLFSLLIHVPFAEEIGEWNAAILLTIISVLDFVQILFVVVSSHIFLAYQTISICYLITLVDFQNIALCVLWIWEPQRCLDCLILGVGCTWLRVAHHLRHILGNYGWALRFVLLSIRMRSGLARCRRRIADFLVKVRCAPYIWYRFVLKLESKKSVRRLMHAVHTVVDLTLNELLCVFLQLVLFHLCLFNFLLQNFEFLHDIFLCLLIDIILLCSFLLVNSLSARTQLLKTHALVIRCHRGIHLFLRGLILSRTITLFLYLLQPVHLITVLQNRRNWKSLTLITLLRILVQIIRVQWSVIGIVFGPLPRIRLCNLTTATRILDGTGALTQRTADLLLDDLRPRRQLVSWFCKRLLLLHFQQRHSKNFLIIIGRRVKTIQLQIG